MAKQFDVQLTKARRERKNEKKHDLSPGDELGIYDLTLQVHKPLSHKFQTKVSLPIPTYNCQVVYTQLESHT